MAQLPLPLYLQMLRSATTEDGPFSDYKGSEKVSEAFARMATAMADFVEAAQELPAVGYDSARSALEDVVHMFPASENPLAAIVEALKKAAESIPTDGPKDASGAYPMPAGKAGEALDPKEADAIADAFAKLLDGLPTAEDPNEKKDGNK